MLKFADRMEDMRPSDIRVLAQYVNLPGFISFAGGLPAPELFPIEDMKTAFNAMMDEGGRDALQYDQVRGWMPLRDMLCDRMAKKNGIIGAAPENIMLTAGSQQGIDFIGKLFLNPGDIVLAEGPSYLGALNCLKAYQCKFVSIPTDEHGPIIPELEKILQTTKNIKLSYTIPDFQNPSGRSWSLERRKQYVDLITKYEIPTIEDNPYGELRFTGETLPSLKAFDKAGLVLYLGTFSKILSPGFRLAWIYTTPELMAKLDLIMMAAALHVSTTISMLTTKYMQMFDIDKHIDKILSCYKHRCDLMISLIDELFPKEVTYTVPEGGMFTWAVLPDKIDSWDLCHKALDRKVSFVPGVGFFPNRENTHCMRLNFTLATDEMMVEGMHRLAGIVTETVKNNK